MSALDAIRERMEACFIFCSYAAPAIREELGIRHLSQVWTELPSWYLWLVDIPGAFMLEMRGGAQFNSSGTDCQGAVGVLRYFPPSDRTAALSGEERQLLASGVFDQTGTPHWESLAGLSGSELFVVGNFEMYCPVEDDDLIFLFEPVGAGADENPGVHLFDRLVGMHAYAAQRAPSGPFSWGQNGRAAAIGKQGSGERFLRCYLASEGLNGPDDRDPAARKWSALAGRTPVAAEGGGCCGGH